MFFRVAVKYLFHEVKEKKRGENTVFFLTIWMCYRWNSPQYFQDAYILYCHHFNNRKIVYGLPDSECVPFFH